MVGGCTHTKNKSIILFKTQRCWTVGTIFCTNVFQFACVLSGLKCIQNGFSCDKEFVNSVGVTICLLFEIHFRFQASSDVDAVFQIQMISKSSKVQCKFKIVFQKISNPNDFNSDVSSKISSM